MTPSADTLLAQAALARRLLTAEQIDEARAHQPEGTPLSAVLIRRKLLTAAQVASLAAEVESMKARTATHAGGATIVADGPAAAPSAIRRSGSDVGHEQRAIATQDGAGQGISTQPSARRTVSALEGGRFGRYRLEEQIGQGGMGVVYRAVDTEMRRTVAIKVLAASGDDADGERVKRFQREAETAGKLRHPNIVTIYEVGCEGGHHFFAMDFIEGTDLAHLIAARKIKLDDALAAFLQVVEAIDYAHRQRVIHRDLKPQNIMIDKDGRAYVTDFGLAKQLSARTQLTQTGKVLGTPMYMAPEQANAEAGKVDTRTDVYALGAILYEILTARPPFDGNSPAEIVYSVLFRDPVPPTRLSRRVPPDLETICLKALEKEPERRFASAADLAADLKRFLDGEPIRAKPVSSFSRVLRKVRRHRGAFLGTVASLLLGTIAASWGWVYYQRASEQQRLAEEHERKLAAERAEMEKQRQAREQAAALLRRADHEESARAIDLCAQALALDPGLVAARLKRAKALQKLDRDQEAADELTRALESDPGNIQALYDRSQIYAWGLGDNEKAEADIRALLARDPENLLAREGAACLLLLQSRNVDAAAALGEVIALDPTRWGPYYYRACALMVGGLYREAIDDLSKALERKPDNPASLLVDRAKARNWSLEAQEALADAEQALRLEPGLASALMEKALALKMLGRREEALAAAEEAAGRAPNNAEIIARKAQVHRQFNDLEAALATCNQALAINPRCIMALSTRAEIHDQQGRYKEAIADCDAILSDSDLWHDAHATKGQALRHLGDLDGALQELSRAVELRPNEPNAYYERSRVYEAMGDAARMQIDLTKHIDLLSARKIDSAAFHVVLGRAHAMAGRIQEAIAHYTKAIERDPGLDEAYRDRCALLVQARRLDLARKDAEKYLEISPGDFDAHRMAALIHLVSGEFPQAVAAYEKAVELSPAGSTEVWNNLAHAYNMCGKLDKALDALDRGLALDPTNTGVLYNQSCLLGKTGRIDEAIETLARAIQAGYDHYSYLDEDPDMAVLQKSDAFAPAVAQACIERAKSRVETGRSLETYSPAQAKREYQGAVEVLGLAAGLVPRIASRSLKAQVHWHRGTAFRYLGARDKQIADLETATKFDPSYESRWRSALGRKELDEGRPAEAVREFSAAIELEPELAEAWCERGKARLELGDLPGALEDLETGFRKWPDLKPYYQTEYKRAQGGK